MACGVLVDILRPYISLLGPPAACEGLSRSRWSVCDSELFWRYQEGAGDPPHDLGPQPSSSEQFVESSESFGGIFTGAEKVTELFSVETAPEHLLPDQGE